MGHFTFLSVILQSCTRMPKSPKPQHSTSEKDKRSERNQHPHHSVGSTHHELIHWMSKSSPWLRAWRVRLCSSQVHLTKGSERSPVPSLAFPWLQGPHTCSDCLLVKHVEELLCALGVLSQGEGVGQQGLGVRAGSLGQGRSDAAQSPAHHRALQARGTRCWSHTNPWDTSRSMHTFLCQHRKHPVHSVQ